MFVDVDTAAEAGEPVAATSDADGARWPAPDPEFTGGAGAAC